MKKPVVLIFVALLSMWQLTAFGQVKVKGIVIDADTKEALMGATVYAEDVKKGTVCSENGSFTLDLPAGKHELRISYVGYVEKLLPINGGKNENLQLNKIALASNSIGMKEVYVVASFVNDRKTPIPVSTIKPLQIEEKLGNQEFPEVLKATPSVYVTKNGGGFGDSRIAIRGFDSNNFAVLINGVPVNDMENGKVYWSNWAGLSDVTQTMQVQRGLGASKLALASVGGTINILSKSTDAEKGGFVYSGLGNDGLKKQTFSLSTGLQKDGWAITLLGSHTASDGYIKATDYETWTYFANVSKIINDKHRLSFTAFGAPQWHNQRGTKHLIADYRNSPDGIKFNSDYGYLNGQQYNAGSGYNVYHKPQFSLNHFWTINDKTSLSTAVYASISQGGGRTIDGAQKNWLSMNYNVDGRPYAGITKLTPDGYLDYGSVITENAASSTGSQAIVGLSVNQHQWYGILSTFNKSVGNFNFTTGFDGRYYKAQHYKEVVNLLGGKYFLDAANINRAAGTPLKKGDKYSYYNDGVVAWGGVFGQAEYTKDSYSTFISASVSNNSYRRVDYFLYKPENKNSDWLNFHPYSVKAGGSMKLAEYHNLYVNAGYFTRAPYMNIAFLNNTNATNKNAKYEKIASLDLGYKYLGPKVTAQLSLYYTNWKDRGLVKTYGTTIVNIPGINALHKGVELELNYKPTNKLSLNGMVSVGDWKWQNDVGFTAYDDNQVKLGEYNAYIGGVHVGNSAQTTAALSADYEVLPKLKIGVNYNYFGRNYADFDVFTLTNPNLKSDSWKMPDVGLVDLNLSWKFNVSGLKGSFFANVNNLLGTEYIADAKDGSTHDYDSALVYYGFGTTWSTGVKINF
ncbi:MAG: TonB-dependent receptor [Bacteroidales bacterium]|nr:TonB-dependent receptor [Bacteroidales bacterium]